MPSVRGEIWWPSFCRPNLTGVKVCHLPPVAGIQQFVCESSNIRELNHFQEGKVLCSDDNDLAVIYDSRVDRSTPELIDISSESQTEDKDESPHQSSLTIYDLPTQPATSTKDPKTVPPTYSFPSSPDLFEDWPDDSPSPRNKLQSQ